MPAPRHSDAGIQSLPSRFIFALQLIDQIRRALYAIDQPDALAAAPNIPPCLGARNAAGFEVHFAGIRHREIVGVESQIHQSVEGILELGTPAAPEITT